MTTLPQTALNINDLQAFGRIGDDFFAYIKQDAIQKAYALGRKKVHIGTVQGNLEPVAINRDEAIELKEVASLYDMIQKFLPTSKTSWVFWLK